MPSLRLSALALFVALALPAAAVPASPFAPGATLRTAQWQPLDLVFQAAPPAGNPFDVAFAATFTGPGGDVRVVPGFYDGADRYVVRFAPPSAGEWRLVTASPLPALHGLVGTLVVSPAPAGRHGPVGVAPTNRRQFAHADGKAYFPIAFEIDWLFALDAENPAGIPKTETLLGQVAANGFNQVVMNVFANDVQWRRDPRLDPQFDYGKPRVFPFGGTNSAPEHNTLSVAFFQRLDRVLEALDRHGLVAHLMIYVWNKRVTWPAARSPDDNRYFDYVVKRYQAFPNLIWDISKEATGYGHDDKGYITDRIDRLRSLDGHRRLVTVHDYGYCADFPSKVDFISIQHWASELWSVMMDVRAKHPGLPVFNIEHGGYEKGPFHVFDGSYLSPEVCLDRAYLSVFAGAFPTHYWQDTSWNVVVHDPAALPEKDRPRLAYYRHLAALVARAGLGSLEPARNLSNTGFCLTNGTDRYAYFIPARTACIAMENHTAKGKPRHSTWFNPLTGEFRPDTVHDRTPSDVYFPPSDDQSWILLVEILPH